MENILHQEFESLEEDVGDGDNCIEESNLDDTDNQQKYQWYVGPKYSWYPPQKDIDDCLEALSSEDEYGHTDPYDKFMRRHLQHYGYYTGRNASFRDNFQSLQEWRRNYDVRLSGHHDLSLMEEQLGKPGNPLHNRLLEGPWEGQLPDDLLHRTTQLVFQYQAGRKIPKLREPRNLYALTKEAGPQQATRWPSHMQVVCPAIRFLDVTPANPEPLYKPTGKEPTPSVRGPQIGEMIYYNDPGRDLYFMRSRVAGCRLAMRSMTLTPRDYPEDNLTLEFESRFESGNLLKVDKISDFEYELTLRTDLYTNKHTQWYFFRVRNMRPGKTYRFTVVNLMKPSSLYNQGMRPLFYSDSNAKKNKIGWVRFGTNIRYYRNNLCSRDGRCFYSLTWQCDFPYKDDTCYFAHCYPYTYTDLQEYLLMLANDPVRSRFCKQRVLCRTLAGNLVYILTITSPSRNPEISRAKKAVVLSARVHPGETNASWMMKGFLDYLTGKSADAKLLRDTFIFKIVPMLNPDGVIVGNYRCSLAGRDLNRNYKSVLKDSFPSIWHTKMMVKKLRAEREVVLYCDLHGHSRKNNIFIYGCENKHNPQKRLRERVFPLMLSKNAHQSFSFDSCKYKVQKSKEGTGRIVMWYLGIMNSYTLEATFGGTSLPGTRKDTHLNTHDLEQIGFHFCDTLLDYCDPDLSKVEACMHELQERMRRQIMKKLRLQGSEDINIDDYMSDMESDTSGSDSSCDDGLPVHLLAIAPKLQRKKKMRTRRERNKANPSKTVVPQATESTKPTSHSAKTASDKIKAIRYSQGSNKKRDDRMTPSRPSAHSASSYTDDRGTSNDRSAKKFDGRSVVPLRTNRATFVQFEPPNKLITNTPSSSKAPGSSSSQRSTVSSGSLGPTPTCIRMRSGDCSNFKIENYVRALSKQHNESEGVEGQSVESEKQRSLTQQRHRLQKIGMKMKQPFLRYHNVAKQTSARHQQAKTVSPGQVNLGDMLHFDSILPSSSEQVKIPSRANGAVTPQDVKNFDAANAFGQRFSNSKTGKYLEDSLLSRLQNLPSILEVESKHNLRSKTSSNKSRKTMSAPNVVANQKSKAKSGPRALGGKKSRIAVQSNSKAKPSHSGLLKITAKTSIGSLRYPTAPTKVQNPTATKLSEGDCRVSQALKGMPPVPSSFLDNMRHKWFPLRCSKDLSKHIGLKVHHTHSSNALHAAGTAKSSLTKAM